MKTIALIDPFWTGHHAMYLELFSRVLLHLGHRVLVFCPEPEKLGKMVGLSDDTQGGAWQAITYTWATESPSRSRWTTWGIALNQLKRLKQLLTATEYASAMRIDLVFFCLLDEFIGHFQTAIDFDRNLGRPFSGLYFLPVHLRLGMRHAWARRGPLNPEAVLFSRYCRSVAVLDEGIVSKLSERLNRKPVICFPDVTDEIQSKALGDLEIAIRAKANGRKIIGLFGSLGKHKGLLTMIQHTQALQNQPVFFAVLGKVAEQSFTAEENQAIHNWMANAPDNVFALQGFIKDEISYNGLVRACDLLYAVYQNFPHSSNILTKAACLCVPVVVSDRYLMGERVKQFHLGFTIREDAPEDFRVLVSSEKTFVYRTTSEFQEGCRAYSKQHSIERLSASFEQVLKYC